MPRERTVTVKLTIKQVRALLVCATGIDRTVWDDLDPEVYFEDAAAEAADKLRDALGSS